MQKKVLIITYYWPPSGGPGVQRWVKFAKYLTRLNVDTYVLTVNPEYATYPQIDESLFNDIPKDVKVFQTKSFDPYSLYKKVSSNNEVPYGGFVNTKKVDFKEKALRFIRGNFFIPDSRRGWNRFAIKKAKEIIKSYKIDTIITTGPPHSTQLIGLALKKKTDINWISDFRDPWTDIFYNKLLYPTKITTWINKKLEKKVLSKSDTVITVSDDLKRLLSEKIADNHGKIKVVSNGYDTDDFTNIIPIEKEDGMLYISYVGTISDDYTLEGLIEGLDLLDTQIKAKIRLRFVGKISDNNYKKFQNAGLANNIECIGYVKHKIAINYMFSSNILLLIIPNLNNNKGILTGKLFEYMASECPILLIGPTDGDAAKILRTNHQNLICGYNEPKKITDYITTMYSELQKAEVANPKISKPTSYSRESLTKNLLKYI